MLNYCQDKYFQQSPLVQWNEKNIYKQALKVFLLFSCPSASGFFRSSSSTKSALLAGPLRAVLTTLDNIWLKGESYRLQEREKWESSSDPSHLTSVCSGGRMRRDAEAE